MDCRRVLRRISLYSDRRLTPEEQSRVALHLETCVSCRQEFASFAAAMEAIGSLDRQPAAPGGWDRLRAEIEARGQVARPTWQAVFATPAGLAVSAAAMLALAVSLVVLQPGARRHQEALSPSTSPPAVTGFTGPRTQTPSSSALPSVQGGTPRGATPAALSESANATVAKADGPPSSPARRKRMAIVRPNAPAVRPMASDMASDYLEPDPEPSARSSRETVYASESSDPDSVSREVAQMVSTGLAPLVDAADSRDPLYWITDVDTEEWL